MNIIEKDVEEHIKYLRDTGKKGGVIFIGLRDSLPKLAAALCAQVITHKTRDSILIVEREGADEKGAADRVARFCRILDKLPKRDEPQPHDFHAFTFASPYYNELKQEFLGEPQ